MSRNEHRPSSYALLVLPSKATLRAQGLPVNPSAQYGTTRDHAYAKWRTCTFPKGAAGPRDLAQAQILIKAELQADDRILKARVNFPNGQHVVLVREGAAAVAGPSPLRTTGTYDPHGVFFGSTDGKAVPERHLKQAELSFLVGADGRPLNPKKHDFQSHFHKERLYNDFPRPAPSQTGFSFTPMSYTSFSLRPNYKIPGCRPGIGDFCENAASFRPRGFATAAFENCEEVDARNRIRPSRLARAGKGVYNSNVFRTQSEKKGGPIGSPAIALEATGVAGSPLKMRKLLESTGGRTANMTVGLTHKPHAPTMPQTARTESQGGRSREGSQVE